VTPYLLVLAVLLGIAPGLIAHSKGRNFVLWWVYGILLGPVALLHAILLRRNVVPSPFVATPRRTRWRSNWPAVLWAATSVAVAIVAVTIYGLLSPPGFDLPKPPQETARSADRVPAAEQPQTPPPTAQPSEPGSPPTVRVTLRHEPPPTPAEKLERAPVMPVERMTSGDSVRPGSTLERTLPRDAPAKASEKTAARPTPAEPAPSPATPAPPAPPTPPVAMLTPSEQAAGTETTAAAPTPAPKAVAPAPSTAPAPAPTSAPAPNNVTAVGETVRIVQLALREKGYDPGPANGRAGKKTQAAIRKFQAERKLEPTGTIDYPLLETLGIVGPRVHAFRPPPGATVGR
jgi:hypothetical protein